MSFDAYTNSGQSGNTFQQLPIKSPRDPISFTVPGAYYDIADPDGGIYQIGREWQNTASLVFWRYIGQGTWDTVAESGLTVDQYAVLLGGPSDSIVSLPPSATVGLPLISQGTGVNPAFGVLPVSGGGTGSASLTGILTGNGAAPVTASTVTPNGVLYGRSANLVGSTAVGTAGQVLQSAGTGNPPVYSTATYASGPGTMGQVLTSNGTGYVPATIPAGAGALVFVAQQVVSSPVASIAFTSIGTYDTYMLIVRGSYPSIASGLNMLISTNGGASYIATGYISSTMFTPNGANTWSNVNSTSAFLMGTNQSSTLSPGINGTYNIYNLQTGDSTCFDGSCVYSVNGGTQNYATFSCSNTNTAIVNALSIQYSSGNIVLGTFTLYGIVGS